MASHIKKNKMGRGGKARWVANLLQLVALHSPVSESRVPAVELGNLGAT